MAKTSQLSESVGINARNEKCGDGRDEKTYPCGSWVGLSPQLLPSYPTFLSTCVAHPVPAPSYLCRVRESPTRSPEFGHTKRAPSLNHQSPEPEDGGGTSVHFSCFISTQLRLLCESSALLQPQTASPPPPSSTGSTTASLWLTGDGGATEGQPVCAPPRRLLGKEKPAEGKRDAG